MLTPPGQSPADDHYFNNQSFPLGNLVKKLQTTNIPKRYDNVLLFTKIWDNKQ